MPVDENGTTTPSTFVRVDKPEEWEQHSGGNASLDPRTASVLGAVLLATAEQVSASKLATFGVSSALDLPTLGLAMAFRDDDSGLVGDVFECSVLLAANGADEQIAQMLSDALTLSGVQLAARPQAVLVAAERGRLVQYSPDLPRGAALATGAPRASPARRQPAGLSRYSQLEGRPAAWRRGQVGRHLIEEQPTLVGVLTEGRRFNATPPTHRRHR